MKMTLLYMVFAALMTACGSTGSASSDTATGDTVATALQRNVFDADGAMALTRQQCDFGPRVPGTQEHAKCGDWLVSTLQESCDTVMVQTATMQSARSGKVEVKNIIGVINPDASKRLLLLAHWDTRP